MRSDNGNASENATEKLNSGLNSNYFSLIPNCPVFQRLGNEAGDRVQAQKDTIKFIACCSRSQENLRLDHLRRSCA